MKHEYRRDVAPIRNFTANGGLRNAELRWSNSGSDEKSETLYYVIYRRNGEGVYRQVGRSEETRFIDRRVPPGQYEYRIRVFSKDGNQSELSSAVFVSVSDR